MNVYLPFDSKANCAKSHAEVPRRTLETMEFHPGNPQIETYVLQDRLRRTSTSAFVGKNFAYTGTVRESRCLDVQAQADVLVRRFADDAA